MQKSGVFKYYAEALAGLILIYVGIRIFTLDITNDEAYSYHNVKQFWFAEFLCTGNSHWLNSLWMGLCTLTGFEQVPVLRLYSFFSLCVFMYCILKFIKDFKTPIRLFGICILLLNPYVLDYFVLARGYSGGMMFELLSLFLFFKALKQPERKIQFLSLLCACLAGISNYSFLYFLLPFTSICFYHFYIKEKQNFFAQKRFYADTVVLGAAFLLIFFAVRFISRCSNDYVGAGTGNAIEAIKGLLSGYFYRVQLPDSVYHSVLLMAFVWLVILSVLIGIFRKKVFSDLFFYNSLMIILSVALIFVGKQFFNGVYPQGRSALFLFPMITLNLFLFMGTVKFLFRNYVLYVLGAALIFNFALRINFSFTQDFKAQRNTKDVFIYLNSIGAKNVLLVREVYGVYKNYYSLLDNTPFKFEAQKATFIDGKLKVNIANDYLIIQEQKPPVQPETDSVKIVPFYSFTSNGFIICKLVH